MLRRTVGEEEIGQTLEHVVGSEPSGNNDCQAAAREFVEHDQHAESATVLCPILDEVVMARKRYTTEQIIGLLGEAEVRLGQGQTIGTICAGRPGDADGWSATRQREP